MDLVFSSSNCSFVIEYESRSYIFSDNSFRILQTSEFEFYKIFSNNNQISSNLYPRYVIINVGDKVGGKKGLNPRRTQILKEMRNNPNITQEQLVNILGVSLTTVENNIRYLKKNGYIERVGSNKTGYWQVIE